jgi:predicted nucleic acid-binding protein
MSQFTEAINAQIDRDDASGDFVKEKLHSNIRSSRGRCLNAEYRVCGIRDEGEDHQCEGGSVQYRLLCPLSRANAPPGSRRHGRTCCGHPRRKSCSDYSIIVKVTVFACHLIAPPLVTAEIGNALWKKALRREMTRNETVAAFRLAVSHFAELVPLDDFREKALELAIELRHPICDCYYIALAERERCALITADARLIAAAKAVKGVELRSL